MTTPSKSAAKQVTVFQVNGEKVVVRTKRNRRARRMTLRIDAANDCAVLVLPSRASFAEGIDFARSKAPWVKEKLKSLPPRLPFAPGETLRVKGRLLTIRYDNRVGPRALRDGDILRVGGDPDRVRERVIHWLRECARCAITKRVEAQAAQINKKFRRACRATNAAVASVMTNPSSYLWHVNGLTLIYASGMLQFVTFIAKYGGYADVHAGATQPCPRHRSGNPCTIDAKCQQNRRRSTQQHCCCHSSWHHCRYRFGVCAIRPTAIRNCTSRRSSPRTHPRWCIDASPLICVAAVE